MFEVDNLSEASPATISRCGMVYMDPKALLPSHVYYHYVNSFPQAIKAEKEINIRLEELFEYFFVDCLYMMRKECKQLEVTSENNYCVSFLNIVNSLFIKAKPNEFGEVNSLEVTKINQSLELIVIYALVWSIGANTDMNGRLKFDSIIRNKVEKYNLQDAML